MGEQKVLKFLLGSKCLPRKMSGPVELSTKPRCVVSSNEAEKDVDKGK